MLVLLLCSPVAADEVLTQYFAGLRSRGLFVVAEQAALDRLQDGRLPAAYRWEIVTELLLTLAERAWLADRRQRDELLDRARELADRELTGGPRGTDRGAAETADRATIFERLRWQRAQLRLTAVRAARFEVALQPHDVGLRADADDAVSQALAEFAALEADWRSRLDPATSALPQNRRPGGSGPSDAPAQRTDRGAVAPTVVRSLLAVLQMETATAHLSRAAWQRSASPERIATVGEATAALQDVRQLTNDPRLTLRAKLGLVEAELLKGFPDRAWTMLAALSKEGVRREESSPATGSTIHSSAAEANSFVGLESAGWSPWLRDQAEVLALQALLDLDRPIDAAERMLARRRAGTPLSGELWLTHLLVLQELERRARRGAEPVANPGTSPPGNRTTQPDGSANLALADELKDESRRLVEAIRIHAGDPWVRWSQRAWDMADRERVLGGDLSRWLEAAEAQARSNQPAEAAAAYARAVAIAAATQPHMLPELTYTHGLLLIEARQEPAALEALQALAERQPPDPRTPAASLLIAFARGRLYERERTQSLREAFEDSLRKHLEQFPNDPTSGDAAYMLAQHEEQRRQWSRALPLYRQVTAAHPRYWLAVAGGARCRVTIATRLKTLNLPIEPFLTASLEELTQLSETLPTERQQWSPEQVELGLRRAQLLLCQTPPHAAVAERALSELLAIAEQALATLTQTPESGSVHGTVASPSVGTAAPGATLQPAVPQSSPNAVPSGRSTAVDNDRLALTRAWKTQQQALLATHLVALAASGRSLEAKTRLQQIPAEPPEGFVAVILALDELLAANQTADLVDLTELLLEAFTRLPAQRTALSAPMRSALDLAEVRALFRSGRSVRAVPLAERLAQAETTDRDRLRILAGLAQQSSSRDAKLLALKLWRQSEAQAPAGSPEWLAARAEVIASLLATEQTDEARKLLKLTRTLYPDIRDERLKERFRQLDAP